jgi:hypothetical protein
MHRLAQIVSVACVALLAAACGTEEPEAQLASTTQSAAPREKAPEDPTAKMARAVGDGKPGAAVELRYEFAHKPEVGVPTELEIAFVPRAGVDALDATITGMDGVTVAGNLKPHFDNVQTGQVYQHKVTLLPDQAGVYYITVAVTTQLSGASVGRTFTIPFVAGTSAAAQRKPEPTKDSEGQAVESMKAVETTEE